jgi:hypothetical protein
MQSSFICLGMEPVAGCGKTLTDAERHYYTHSCEACVQKWNAAITAWTSGGSDDALDRMYSVVEEPKKVN